VDNYETTLVLAFDIDDKVATSMLGHVPPHEGVLSAQVEPKKSKTYQPLIEVRIQRLRCLLGRYKEKTLAALVAVCVIVSKQAKNVAAAVRE
jgi:hypothetical protein